MTVQAQFRTDAHAVIIGINEYQDPKIPNLKFARADAEGIHKILVDPELGRIPPERVTLLLDENATERRIRTAIGTELAQRAGANDLVMIYYAGHGSPVINPCSRAVDGMEKYLVPADAQIDNLRATGISMDDIQKFFGYIESNQIMFFIDSCYSGQAGGRTFQDPRHQQRHLQLSREFLEDLAGEGRLVVTACDVNEVSLETPEMGHGLFTHYLMEGLKGLADKDQDGLVTMSELYDYVAEHVSRHARQLNGSMHPIQKGLLKGKIFLTQYETLAQKQARELQARAEELHRQAQADYDSGRVDTAWATWQNVLQLAPAHAAAQQGLAMIENKRQQEQRQRQEKLEHQQRILLDLKRAGKLPVDEFNVALSMFEKSQEELTGIEREIREFLDDLIAGKISPENYVKSLRLLRQPLAREEPASKAEDATEEQRIRKAEEERRRRAEEEQRRKAEKEQKRKAEEARIREADEERKWRAEEAKRQKNQEEWRRKAEEDEKRKVEEEEQKRKSIFRQTTGWTIIGWAITWAIGWVIGDISGGVIGWLIGSIITVFVLGKKYPIIQVISGWFWGSPIGAGFCVVFPDLIYEYDIIGWTIDRPIRLAIGWALGASIAGLMMWISVSNSKKDKVK